MEEMMQRTDNELVLLSSLAREARMYSEAAALNLFQLGRVLIEAKKLVRHGEWTDWVRGNAHMSETQAQYLMRSYERFGQMPEVAGLEKSKIFKMLSLPAGTEQAFIEKHDVPSMTAREVERAVQQVKADAEERVQAERRQRIAAEARADELAARPPEIPADIAEQMNAKDAEIARIKAENARITAQANDLLAEKNSLWREKNALSHELQDAEEMLSEKQKEYNDLNALYLDAQSITARGDTERTTDDRLTAGEFTRAVGQFIGLVSRVPHMGRAFAAMGNEDRDAFITGLEVVEEWAAGARKAMDTIEMHMEGAIIHAE